MLHRSKRLRKEVLQENKIKRNIPYPIKDSCATYKFQKIGKAFIGHPDHTQPKPVAPKTRWWGKIPTDNSYYA